MKSKNENRCVAGLAAADPPSSKALWRAGTAETRSRGGYAICWPDRIGSGGGECRIRGRGRGRSAVALRAMADKREGWGRNRQTCLETKGNPKTLSAYLRLLADICAYLRLFAGWVEKLKSVATSRMPTRGSAFALCASSFARTGASPKPKNQ